MANPNRNDKDLMINVTTNYKGVSSDKVFDIAVMSLFLNKDRQSSVCKKGAKLWKGMSNGERRQQNNPTSTN